MPVTYTTLVERNGGADTADEFTTLEAAVRHGRYALRAWWEEEA
jgi:hypothetical protein